MERTAERIKTSKRNFILALALLLLTNILMGVVLMSMAKHSLREQMEQRMLDVANTAAAQLNGDDMESLTAADKGTEKYKRAYAVLSSFQENIQLDYIYAAKEQDGSFIFTIDPDMEDPGEFGEKIVVTPAMRSAARGFASVDKKAHSDEWGRFYSAYSPIRDSEGNVVGIVGVDFDADWFDSKISGNRMAAVIIVMAAMTVGIVLSFLIMSQNRRRFMDMLKSMDNLYQETRVLDEVITKSSISKLDFLPSSESEILKTLASGETHKKPAYSEYDELHSSIDAIYDKLHNYISYVEKETYTDFTTGTCNKAAYKNRIREMDDNIQAGNANFSVAFFDINGIKRFYTYRGFEAGEEIMFACAEILNHVFGKSNVFHVTGDEFVIIMDKKSRPDMRELFNKFEEGIRDFNKGKDPEEHLSVAKGFATYDSILYQDYRHVFIDAKGKADKDKEDHYKKITSLSKNGRA